MELTDKIKSALTEIAEANPTEESCAILVLQDGDICVKPVRNTSEKPAANFCIALADFRVYMESGSLVAYFHSHVTEDAVASIADRRGAEEAQIPCIIYSLAAKTFSVYQPVGDSIPLEGRPFVFGELDCFSLVEDYYRVKLGIQLTPVKRDLRDLHEGISSIDVLMRERALMPVSAPKPHDIICLSVANAQGKCNHLGIFLEGGNMLHQLMYRPSEVTVYKSYWEKHTLFFARHKNNL